MNVAFVTDDISETGFTVWGVDKAPYGPVELPTLVAWIKDERVTAETWIYIGRAGAWQKAAEIPELQLFFCPRIPAQGDGSSSSEAVKPAALRRVKILGSM